MSELKTPIFDLTNFPTVYEPSEDSFLLLDVIELEIDLIKSLKPKCILEVGSGSGLNIVGLGTVLKSNCAYFATDINTDACLSTLHTAALNNVTVECLNLDLATSFICNCFDVVLFNSPYVVTDPNEIVGRGLSRAWAGGHSGRQIIDRFLMLLPNILSEIGVCYLVVIKENNVDEIKELMFKAGLFTKIVKERKIRGEHLYVLKFHRL